MNKNINLVGNGVADAKTLKTNNRVNIDWLSLNFKGVDAYTLLEVFCNSTVHEDISITNFVYNERGIVTGYTESYSYLDTPYLVVSFCTGRDEMGVNIQITGQGCKLIYIDDIKRFLTNMSQYTTDYKCNRLDIAYDDFEKIIPVDEIVEYTQKELSDSQNQYVFTRIKRDMITVYQNHFDGKSSYNVLYGKHRSARSFRLYDKKLEQKIKDDECKYWYRLEIELRSKGKSTNADDAFHQFISGQKNIFELFYDNISTIVTFVIPFRRISNGSFYVKPVDFWKTFLDVLFTSHNTYYAK